MKTAFLNLVLLFALTSCQTALTTAKVKPERVLGIFGGMGPEATANLYAEIVRLTPAKKDQDHIPTPIYSRPQVPDRSACIASGSREIAPYIQEAVTRLERGGACVIAIPCNTVHYYYDDMQKVVRIPVLNMIEEAADVVQRDYPKARTVGLLATNGTVKTGLYTKAFEKRGIKVVLPDADTQQCCVMNAVYSIKSGGSKATQARLLERAGHQVVSRGADVIVLGCTEIPLASQRRCAEIMHFRQ